MKKKIINGLLMAALMLTATTSFVSCKDNVDDELVSVYDNLSKQKSALQQEIQTLKTTLEQKIKDNADAIAQNKQAISDLQDRIVELERRLGEIDQSISTMQGDIAQLQQDLNTLSNDVNAFKSEVNSRLDAIEEVIGESIQDFSTDWFVNSVFGSSKTPFGVELKGFAAYFGENLTYITDFPTTERVKEQNLMLLTSLAQRTWLFLQSSLRKSAMLVSFISMHVLTTRASSTSTTTL